MEKSHKLSYIFEKTGKNPEPEEKDAGGGSPVAQSEIMKDILRRTENVSPLKINVLITGETGTGKEVIANELYRGYKKSLGKNCGELVVVHAGSIPEELVVSEFFGAKKGSYTGANEDKTGFLKLADRGVLFLDEVSKLSLDTQASLIRVLETKIFYPVGSRTEITSDFRLVCATNEPLEKLVKRGLFRSDLYYRLKKYLIDIPPLREHRDDILPLAMRFITESCKQYGINPIRLTKAAETMLFNHNWPGNVRELKSAIEQAVVSQIIEETKLDTDSLSGYLGLSAKENIFADTSDVLEPDDQARLVGFEQTDTNLNMDFNKKNLILQALVKTDWNQPKAARLLGISQMTMNHNIRKYGITHSRWRKNCIVTTEAVKLVHGISPEEEELNQKDLGLIKNWRLLTESARTELLTRLLDRYNWNQAALAAVCDIGTNTLYRWMHVLGIKNKRTGATKNISPETIAAEKTLVALEKKRIIEALENSSWIQKDAAKKLGISSRSLHYKLDVLKIDHPRWRKRR